MGTNRRTGTWLAAFAVGATGALLGVVLYAFIYAKGYSYLTNNPEACKNCHIMNREYDAWIKSSHKKVALCNDCHAPKGLLGKYSTKALNGFFHSLYFTTQTFHEPIFIKARNRKITEQACRNCHRVMVEGIDSLNHYSNEVSCLRCHGAVGHPN